MVHPLTRRSRRTAMRSSGDTTALDGRGQWRTGSAHTARPPSEDDHGTRTTGLAGRYRLRPAFVNRNDNEPLQGADRPPASSPRLRCPADRGCHRYGGPEPDAGGWTPEICPRSAGHRIAVQGWGHLDLHPPSAPTPSYCVPKLDARRVFAALRKPLFRHSWWAKLLIFQQPPPP